MKNHFTLRTTITPALLHQTLLKGFGLALIGIFGLLYGSIYVDLSILQMWGFTLFIVSLGLIVMGLLPYRRLSRLQINPNKLCLVEPHQLEFYAQDRLLLIIPMEAIARLEYVANSSLYGIALWIKPTNSVIVKGFPEEVKNLKQQGQQQAGADLFFAYFNERSFEELMQWQKEEDMAED